MVRYIAWPGTLHFPREEEDRLTFPNLFFSHLSYFQEVTAPICLIHRHMLCCGLQLYAMIYWKFVHPIV